MSDIETLLINRIRIALKALNQEGVGYIEQERSGHIYYAIDNRYFDVSVAEEKQNTIKPEGDVR